MTTVRRRPRGAPTAHGSRRRGTRRIVAVLLLIAACWGALLATVHPASGHPVLVTTAPGGGETAKSPDHVLLTFDRPVPAGLATVRVLDPADGSQVVFDRPVHPDGRTDTLSVPLPKERHEGTYTVGWTLPSGGLEPISGSFTFDLSYHLDPLGVPEIDTTRDAVVSGVYLTARTLAVAAMLLLTGAAFFVATVGSARSGLARRVVTSSWWALTASTVVTLLSFGPYAAWVPLGEAFDPALLAGTFESDAGSALLARGLVLIPATLALAELMTSLPADTARERRLRGAGVLGCGAALLATWTYADPRPPGGPSPDALAVDVAVLLAIALPVGGLLLHRTAGAALPRLRRLAPGYAALLAVTAAAHALSAQRLGLLPSGALALALVLLGYAWSGRARTTLDSRDFRDTAVSRTQRARRAGRRAVVATGAAVVLVAGTVAVFALEPAQAAHAQGTGPVPAALRDQVAPSALEYDTGTAGGRGVLDLVLVPASAGPRAVRVNTHVTVLGPGRAPRDDLALTAVFTRGDQRVPLELSRAGALRSTGSATLSGHGRWELAMTVHAADGGAYTVTQPIDVR